ncbi:MAG: hypothetical protein RJA38_551 [Bacteroidota bacterium]|jgi:hypothetical protein
MKNKIELAIHLLHSNKPAQLVRHCSVGDGIVQLEGSLLLEAIQKFEKNYSQINIEKFVPASGAATRMFAPLSGVDLLNPNDEAEHFFLHLRDFPFFKSVKSAFESKGLNYDETNGIERYSKVLDFVFNSGYASLPKGSVPFHSYGDEERTAFAEHCVESMHYMQSNGTHEIHFTIPAEHQTSVENLFNSFFEKNSNAIQKISFSSQDPETHIPALDKNKLPVLGENGEIFLRPAGHGALLKNLQALKGECVFIQNIDNITEASHHADVAAYRKLMGGVLLSLVEERNQLLTDLENNIENAEARANAFIQKWFKSPSNNTPVFDFLNKPLRVCGMVENTGEPGGGPFWVKDDAGFESKQIVEKAQINKEDAEQLNVFENSTHFNPVDMVCNFINHKGNKYNLADYRNPTAALVSEKLMLGKRTNVIELPGLWNGSMWGWNTVFVEIPARVFHPVKTVNDLLKSGHKPKA